MASSRACDRAAVLYAILEVEHVSQFHYLGSIQERAVQHDKELGLCCDLCAGAVLVKGKSGHLMARYSRLGQQASGIPSEFPRECEP